MFDLGGVNHGHATGCKCSGCSPLRPSLWAVYAAMHEIDPQLAQKALQEDGEPDPFLNEELVLAVLLAGAFASATERLGPIIEKMFRPPVTQQQLLSGVDEMATVMDTVVTPSIEAEITRIAERTIVNGVLDSDASVGGHVAFPSSLSPNRPPLERPGSIAAGTILERAPSAARVHQGIVEATKYYTNNYFNTFIVPEINRRIDLILGGAAFDEVPDFLDLRDLLDRRLRSVPYWRVVANAAMSRGYHYGYLKAAELRGITTYQYTAILDSRTSDICQYMHGRTFHVADAARLMERVAGAESVEAVKQLMPWRKLEDIRERSNDELRDLGVIVPPLHGNCRSRLIII